MRKMSITDYEQVYALWLETEGMGLSDIDESYEGIERFLLRNPNTCFVEERDGQIVGVILAGHDGRRGTLHHLAVKDEYRRKGIATALVSTAIEALKEEDIPRVALFLYNDNKAGKQFWLRQGFEIRDDIDYMDKNLTEIRSLTEGRKN